MAPLIETKRLILRAPALGEELSLHRAIHHSLPELQRWMPWAKNADLPSTINYINNALANWSCNNQKDFPLVVIFKESLRIIGASGFNDRSKPSSGLYEIGYWLETQYTNQGLATELVMALTNYALYSLSATQLQIVTQVGNQASRRVAEKCGYRLETILTNYCIDCVSGKAADSWLFVFSK